MKRNSVFLSFLGICALALVYSSQASAHYDENLNGWKHTDAQARAYYATNEKPSYRKYPKATYTSNPTFQPTAENRAHLRNLMQEHTDLAGKMVVARLDDTQEHDTNDEYRDTRLALGENTREIRDTLELMYDEKTARKFKRLWDRHNSLYISYANALKDTRDETKDIERSTKRLNKAKEKLDKFIVEMTDLFTYKVQGTSRDQLTNMFRDHVYFTRQVMEAHVRGDATAESTNKQTGRQHSLAMADILSGQAWDY